MYVTSSSDTPVDFQWTKRHYLPEEVLLMIYLLASCNTVLIFKELCYTVHFFLEQRVSKGNI
jgi:hypothetical protein